MRERNIKTYHNGLQRYGKSDKNMGYKKHQDCGLNHRLHILYICSGDIDNQNSRLQESRCTEIWSWRTMLCVSWMKKCTNVRVGGVRTEIQTFHDRKPKKFAILRPYSYIKLSHRPGQNRGQKIRRQITDKPAQSNKIHNKTSHRLYYVRLTWRNTIDKYT